MRRVCENDANRDSKSFELDVMNDNLLKVFGDLVSRIYDPRLEDTGIVKTWAPVPYFGDIANSTVATVGLNPSNKEFEDDGEQELRGSGRRFHTLNSLGLEFWSELSGQGLISIKESCDNYFDRNPYWRWFGGLRPITSELNISFGAGACHLDLVPYATNKKWSKLSQVQRRELLEVNRRTLTDLVWNSPLRILVLNGTGVIEGFKKAFKVRLEPQPMPSWDLPWTSGKRRGCSYRGRLENLTREEDSSNGILVLGYNHNIPNTPGVNEVIPSIARWIARESEAYLS